MVYHSGQNVVDSRGAAVSAESRTNFDHCGDAYPIVDQSTENSKLAN